MPLIDIIIPVYNVDRYLKRCLDSVLGQNFNDYKILIIDDGSTDESSKICDIYKQKDARIKVIHSSNKGLSSARNIGIKHSTSKYILFLDSDDYLEKDSLEFCSKKIIEHNFPDLLVFNVIEEFENKETKLNNLQSEVLDKNQYLKKLLNNYIYVTAWAKLFKSSLFNNYRFEVGRYHEDELIIHRLIFQCKTNIYIFNEPIYHYFKRNDSITSLPFNNRIFDLFYALLDRCYFLKQSNLKSIAKQTYMVVLDKYRYLSKNYPSKIESKQIKLYLYNNKYIHSKIKFLFVMTKYKIISFCHMLVR